MGGKHIFISGKVQGVGFRFHAHEKAREMGIRGWVRNLPDGRVEVVAFGEPKTLEGYVSWLSQGPSTAEVSLLEQTEVNRKYKGEGFFIRRDGGPTWAED